MSTKGTILNTPWCHIYHDYAHQHTSGKTDTPMDAEVLVIEVDYDFIDYEEYEDQSVIVVEWDSDFAKMIIWMCEQYKHVQLCIDDADTDSQPESLQKIMEGVRRSGDEFKIVNDVLTIKTK